METVLIKFKPHAETINKKGGRLYVVGGAVRDFLMHRQSHDIDFCVTGLTVEQFLGLFPEARIQGKEFPVFVVDGCEFALARTERKCGVGYKGFKIDANPSITIEEDLARRDLSINAIAIDVLSEKIVDPHKGVKDLWEGLIRPTTAAFKEDPVRALRAARFTAQFDFEVSSWVYKYIHELKDELKDINPNMKFTELEKALKGKAPSRFFEVLRISGVLDILYPEIYNMYGVQQAHHTDGDAYEHTMTALEICRKITDNPLVLGSVLYHDVGKGTTPVTEWPAHHGHEVRSMEIIESLDWLPNKYKKYAVAFARDHMRGHRYLEMKKGRKTSLLERISKTEMGIENFCNALYSDKPTLETIKTISAILVDYEVVMRITGKDLPSDVPPGIIFGQRLHQLRSEHICSLKS